RALPSPGRGPPGPRDLKWKGLYVLPFGQMSYWGELICRTWSDFDIDNILFSSLLPFISPKVRASKRIDPHNYEVLSILFGSMLGDCSAEKHGKGVRFCFQQEHSNNAYLLWFHNYLASLGYCSPTIPKLATRLSNKGKIRQLSRFKTFTYTSFNWIYDVFYVNGLKIVPRIISEYLSPLALAVWIMDDGSIVSSGLKIATNSFTNEDVQLLCNVLKEKYGIKATVILAGAKSKDQYFVYISKFSMAKLAQ